MTNISEICTVDECIKPRYWSKPYCRMHYQRFVRYGDVSIVKRQQKRTHDFCLEKDCDKPYASKGLCSMHYARLLELTFGKCKIENCAKNAKNKSKGLCAKHLSRLKGGKNITSPTSYDPRPAIIEGDIAKIPLGLNAKHGYAIVDKEFAYLADEHKWTISDTGYAIHGGTKRANIKMQHLVIGKPKPPLITDHINRDRLDNRKANLRHVTFAQNIQNAKGQPNVSGYKGVAKSGNKWRAYYSPNKKQVHIGIFNTKQEAARAYNEKALEAWGEYAYLNDV